MLNASQKRTNRDAFSLESMSSVPASTLGWFAITPIVRPSSLASPVTTFIAQKREDLEEVAVVDDAPDDLVHVVRLLRGVRDEVREALVVTLWIVNDRVGGRVLQVVRRQVREEVSHHREALLLVLAHERATPDLLACVIAPPSSSNVTSSPVTALMTSGPVMNMCEVSRTMNVKSVMAGE